MNIREFTPGDRIQIVNLMREFGAYLEELDSMRRTDFAPGGAEYFTDRLIKDTNVRHGLIFVAEEHGEIVGFIGGYIGEQDEAELMESKRAVPGIISEFFITGNTRREGVGSDLLKKMEKYLKDQACTLIRFDVFAPNNIARNFYSKHGYQDRSIIMSKDI